MKLVIVESPNKTRKIREFLGPGYRVAASFGHVRDLPPMGGLAVVFKDGRVIPTYQILDKATRAIAELSADAAKAEEVILATDPDREGEAIAWHITQALGERPYKRVVFHAITQAEVAKAMANPRAIDQHLVDAQQARRVLDRVVGWLVSPTLKRVSKDAKSAGRVQSVALRLVAEREREIQRFNVVDYFILTAKLDKPGTPPPFSARLVAWKGEALGQRLSDVQIAERTVDWCRKQPWQVHHCDRRESVRNAPPPFTTATVQQAASVRLALNPDATMKQLQSLFEDGHITYHRTDSVALAPEAIAAARTEIAQRFPKKYLPGQPLIHATKSANAQEAHEAIRPTHPEGGPEAVTGETAPLYALIWNRFIACQMAAGRDQITTLDIACAPGTWNGGPMGLFQAKGKVVIFDGWRKLTGDATEEDQPKKKRGRKKPGEESEDDDESAELPLLNPGDAVNLIDLAALKRSTKPPPRYTQASLIKKLEHDGIGRPSTYANILRTILERGYVGEKLRKLFATDLGMQVTDFLVARYAGNFIDMDYTRRMEDQLDRIARGETTWEPVVTDISHAVLALARRAGLTWNPLTGEPPPWLK